LVANINLDPLLQVTPICAAASEWNGQMDFCFDDEKTISVRTVRLDDYSLVGWPAPQFIKIDVEGAAGAVFRVAQSLIEGKRPIIYIELHGPEEQEAVRDLLKTFRYKAQTVRFGSEGSNCRMVQPTHLQSIMNGW
jgi:hypothetical protein